MRASIVCSTKSLHGHRDGRFSFITIQSREAKKELPYPTLRQRVPRRKEAAREFVPYKKKITEVY
ncbi:hypothetical protein EYF80_021729 [Liparis tanakae]|uniref:Uncharacterized protein n=1 Tax=Liparis tanakae TaxID=230148 RepID=A0A4Z2HSV3_9TELE|nr:hypothetical protein EYF80_021729 [Liparis tanakae]